MTVAAIPRTTIAQNITADEFLAMPETKGIELDDGKLVELQSGAESSWVAGQVYAQIWEFNQKQNIGWVFPQDTAFQCYPGYPNRVRKPDVSFIVLGRFNHERLPDGFITIAPDLVVEVVSPNDTAYEVERKVQKYLSAGVRLVWVIFPETRTTRVHRPGKRVTAMDSADQLDSEDVLPGLRIGVGKLFPTPPVLS